jgi:transglutaminase-like putative cysteine protease
MKTQKIAFLLLIFLFPMNLMSIASAEGISNYEVSQSVTYQVELNYTLTHTRFYSQTYYFKVARLNDRQPNSTVTQYCPPYQESNLLYNSITGTDSLTMGSLDKFNNTYDLFSATLSSSDIITLSQKYKVTLSEVTFGTILDSDIGSYNTSDEMFDLYCNNAELYYERDDPDLIAASNSIVDPSDNPLEKAQKISNWVSNNLTYSGSLPAGEKGASWAYDNQLGDCSEYSTLMVTLLRIQGIPARKVTGFLISADSNLQPPVGQVYNFQASSSGTSTLLGHAWVEYYIPEIGWISCEPQNPNHYKKSDYLRFNLNIGAWFFMPGASPGYDYVSEFPHIPSPVASDHDAYTFNYDVKITVLETSFNSIDLIVIIIFCSILGVVIIGIVLLIKSSRKKRKEYLTY